MLLRRPAVLLSALFLVLAGLGGALVAQMESGERGILPIDSSGTLEITGIKVDVGGKDADTARYAGWRMAQREGFKALWAQTTKRPISQAPNLTDSVLDGLVSSIVVENEQIGPNRYIATLGVLFDRARSAELLGVAGEIRRSAPMLLIPVMISGGTPTSVELRNPWQRAWAQFRTSQSPIDYVRVSGLGVDPLLVNAAQTRRPGRGWWRNVLDLYGAANILVAEVRVDRLYPGGPAKAQFVGRFGPDGTILGSFELVARNSNDLPRMMSEGVRKMDELFVQAHSAGLVRGDPDLIIQPPPPEEVELVEEAGPAVALVPATVVQVLVIEKGDANAVAQSVAQIRGLAGVVWVTQAALPNGNANLSVNFRGDATSLGSALSSRGWAVTNRGGVLYVTRGAAPGVAPAPSPAQP
ncbi:heavy-metal-associated domain-containing protein [Sphingomonas sp. NSE70-1]|uniref:Heavy-metal-associated domain-containing protein n=1 Tax=Sphingomonas caseinilyticus TaxID=2908205 RepID=A0ABT0RS02_9SPHN|nr:heavy-metal-associated domain-containing protein [Sphingomonas caseinilyticus]MCL6697701.1 heavy-metal-associated domain-containing protein [Sphingomonas caseinilyticus]